MNKQLKKSEVLLVGVMLFSLFFGAGNLIFPPFLGQEAGSNTVVAMVGFSLTAIVFPILGVLVVSKTKGLNNLASKVNGKFSFIFTILIYLSIGPMLGIPRAASLPYEMVLAPFVSKDLIPQEIALFIFTATFFLTAYWLAKKPSKLIDRLGKVLTPTLLILIFIVFIGSFFTDFSGIGQPHFQYVDNPLVSGFLDGYQTMDTIAALNFGLVISIVIKDLGGSSEKELANTTIKAGLIAGSLLLIIYSLLAYLGALSGMQYGMTENGAVTLANIMTHIFGPKGVILLATIFTLACLTTAVGLLSSISQYFSTISKIKYHPWLVFFVLWSLFIANFGLTTILSISIPILNAIYPMALMLIGLGLLDKFFKENTKVYKYSICTTSIISIVKVFGDLKILPQAFTKVFTNIPFYAIDLGWLVPALLTVLIVYVYEKYN